MMGINSRRTIKKKLSKKSLEYKELVTLLYDMKAIMNNRSMTYVSQNVEDVLPLGSVMFLQGLPISNKTVDLDTIDRHYLVSRIVDARCEYLAKLVLFGQCNSTLLKVGDIV